MVLSDSAARTEPPDCGPALRSWRGRLRGGSVDPGPPLSCFSGGMGRPRVHAASMASGSCLFSVDLIFPTYEI